MCVWELVYVCACEHKFGVATNHGKCNLMVRPSGTKLFVLIVVIVVVFFFFVWFDHCMLPIFLRMRYT